MNIRWRLAQAAEIRWWKQYLGRRPVAGYLQRKADYWHEVLAAMKVHIPPGSRVLDAGCGPAGLFLILRKQQVTALDPLLAAYDQLPHFNRHRYPWVDFRVGTLEHWSAPRPYPWICCMNAINHVADLERALQALTRSAQAGGQLLLTVDVHRFPVLKQLFRAIPGDVLHPQQHTAQDYRQRLAALGWTIEQERVLKKGQIFNYVGILARKRSA